MYEEELGEDILECLEANGWKLVEFGESSLGGWYCEIETISDSLGVYIADIECQDDSKDAFIDGVEMCSDRFDTMQYSAENTADNEDEEYVEYLAETEISDSLSNLAVSLEKFRSYEE